ncbi:MAG: 16S rRNA (adenine(1518)-N(6)/adenine(1519)-N(6))-dimethyltransferase RsmA [Gammaproteobacteria bacterium]|nr:16S rRNA (adenine(1518)-N(6)/adenine(1519)-N(6))-dimethyltransferase RsmA [Gammaproteobacteria bacterium]MCW8840894.1 16S rRNA (adenine(1518)-N(6)/adenine(1519)-N(6))-dimethyltransferase RsmA [Gammaproteobacteria bacterium]MCW8959811.1 16S rRNA (adenine(1518)-N(6)/adenine(1519)-N(6))-dimethyltransferase RsmA [Gammaproteobacteria bacterium]MCW8971872.1 16S rRNA (adenine(1518)-N(6)/adenine(1519)-N(6))-dimethyltransferase RsmA [Gammaproteobacteria bacterium]MCW8994125.1 16S rRNA (adenine(1518)-
MNHRPRKRFGQNFLHDTGVIRGIIAAIHPRSGEHLVEIGPGLGALTEPLLELLGEMDAVELDRDLVPHLQQLFTNRGELRIHNTDALKFDFCSLLGADSTLLRVVGNLPYNISTPLIFHLLEQSHCIEDMHFMLQKEVVERLAAGPGGGDYGRLSVMVQYHCRVEKLFTVPPGAFNPPPKVYSAIVRLTPYSELPHPARDEKVFARLVAQAFSQRRKTLRNNLKKVLDTATIESLGIDPGARPETLSLQQFVALANAVVEQT